MVRGNGLHAFGLFSFAHDCCDDTGIPAAMEHSNYGKGFFIGGVSNEVISYG